MQSQRRELIRQLDVLLFTLFVYVWFLDKSLLLLALKIGLQVQYCNPASFNPDLPLPILCRTVLFFNVAPIISHAFFWTGEGKSPLDDPDGLGIGGAYSRSGRTGFVLDFIGQAYQPTRLHLLAIDLLITFLQWLFIIIVSETEKAEELRPDLDEFGPLDGDPEHEVVLSEPDAAHPAVRQPSPKGRGPGSGHPNNGRRADGEDDDELSDAGSDAPLRPNAQRRGVGALLASASDASLGDDSPAVPPLFEQSELRTRKRKGKRREGDTASDVVVDGGTGSDSPHGQGWSPRDEEASMFLPTLDRRTDSQLTRPEGRPQGRLLLSERTSLTHPIAHLPLGQLAKNTFTFSPVNADGGSGGSNAATSTAGVDNRPVPRANDAAPSRSTGLTRSERITPGGGGARAGRMVGSRLGIVPLFRRYNEGEEAVSGSSGGATLQRSGAVPLPQNTIPVIALPFTAPNIRITSFGDDANPSGSNAVPSPGPSEGQERGAQGRPPGTPDENSWAWITRNFSMPQGRSGSRQAPQG